VGHHLGVYDSYFMYAYSQCGSDECLLFTVTPTNAYRAIVC
jgi:hypothetical protein